MEILTDYIKNIQDKKLTIYDEIPINDPVLWIPTDTLENILNDNLVGVHLTNQQGGKLPNRSRSKKLKELVSRSLGYPVPSSFKKTQPRFIGQNLDIYGQESNNLQIWNEDIDPNRRYGLIKIECTEIVHAKVVNGTQLSSLDKTGTLTQKFQARIDYRKETVKLLSTDTPGIKRISNNIYINPTSSATSSPSSSTLMSIEVIFSKVKALIGQSVPSSLDTRAQGAYVHKLVLESLGYKAFVDNGQFPDVTNQLLEIKTQTSQTIDLGLFTPDDNSIIPDIEPISGYKPTISDTRYLLVCIKDDIAPKITGIYIVAGVNFFGNTIQQMQGNKLNKKIQIPLPKDFL